ncbi:homogentisate phytyltransferase 1, chloroplastic [Tanacetum coccineum]
MKALIIGSFSNRVSCYSKPLSNVSSSSSSVVSSTGCYRVSLRASESNRVIQSQPSFVRSNFGRFNESFLLSQKRNTQHVASAISEQPIEPDATSPQNTLPNAIDAFYRFSRPHTVIGTALSIVSVSLLAVQKLSDFSPLFFMGVLEAIVAAFFMNIYIVGLNQLSDIEIDKVNKPYLPLASGEYSVRTGVIIVSSFAFLSFWLGWIVGSWPLFWALFISFILGTAYSINMPMLRWKRFALVAAMCILAVRAIIVQVAFYLHIQDIHDILETRFFGTHSIIYRSVLGQDSGVFWICILLLEIAYGVAILVGASSPFLWSRYITVLGHSILGLLLWGRAKSTDLESKSAITSFYMFIWQLFYAEYMLIPLVSFAILSPRRFEALALGLDS